jgi:hypothetical protein
MIFRDFLCVCVQIGDVKKKEKRREFFTDHYLTSPSAERLLDNRRNSKRNFIFFNFRRKKINMSFATVVATAQYAHFIIQLIRKKVDLDTRQKRLMNFQQRTSDENNLKKTKEKRKRV